MFPHERLPKPILFQKGTVVSPSPSLRVQIAIWSSMHTPFTLGHIHISMRDAYKSVYYLSWVTFSVYTLYTPYDKFMWLPIVQCPCILSIICTLTFGLWGSKMSMSWHSCKVCICDFTNYAFKFSDLKLVSCMHLKPSPEVSNHLRWWFEWLDLKCLLEGFYICFFIVVLLKRHEVAMYK